MNSSSASPSEPLAASAESPPRASSSPKRPGVFRRYLGKLLLALVSTIVALLISEGVVRKVYPEYGTPVFSTKLFTEFDPLLGWRKIPGFHGTHVQEEYTIVERFNSRGLRGPEIAYDKPPGVFRILLLGDSFTEGYTVEYEDLFSEHLRRLLSKASKTRIEVINAGTGGYSTDQELLFYRTEGRLYHPDLVVVMYCANDAPMNVKPYYNTWDRGQKPLFEQVDGQLVLKSKPQKTWDREELAGKDRAGKEHTYKQGFAFWNPQTWYLYRLYDHVRQMRNKEPLPDGTPLELAPAEPTPELLADDAFRGRQPEWIMTEALLEQIHKEAADDGAKFLLFNIPEKREIYGAQVARMDVEHNLQTISRRHGIEWIPTVRIFRDQAAALKNTGGRFYWVKDSHWTAEGHRLAGQILAQKIIANRDEYGL